MSEKEVISAQARLGGVGGKREYASVDASICLIKRAKERGQSSRGRLSERRQ